MSVLMRPWGPMFYRDRGPATAPAVIFANSLGTDSRMWDALCDRLPGLRCIQFDKRGHGLSATPVPPWQIEDLAADVLALIDQLGLARATIVGCSVGGMIAQALALAAPDRVAGLVLSNSAAQMGNAETWQARITALQQGGMAAIAEAILQRWFAPDFLASDQVHPWRRMLLAADLGGYIGTCGVLAAADLRATVGAIGCPVLMIAGSADLAAPVALVEGTAALIPGARVVVLPGSGHIPAIDSPAAMADLITDFLAGLA